jgi:hypothetical protein
MSFWQLAAWNGAVSGAPRSRLYIVTSCLCEAVELRAAPNRRMLSADLLIGEKDGGDGTNARDAG